MICYRAWVLGTGSNCSQVMELLRHAVAKNLTSECLGESRMSPYPQAKPLALGQWFLKYDPGIPTTNSAKMCLHIFGQLWFHSLSLKKTALSFRTAPHLHNPRPFACLNLEPPKLLVPSTCCCNILKYFEQPESLKAHHDLFCAVSSRGWCCCPILGWQFWQK